MKLFYMRGAGSLADHIVLEWSGEAYETVRMDRVGIKTPEYLALNPTGVVPLLVDGDLALTENVAILGYLSDLHPQLQLAGDGSPRSRAEAPRLSRKCARKPPTSAGVFSSSGRYIPSAKINAGT